MKSVGFFSGTRLHKMSATTNKFSFAKKEWPEEARNVLYNFWLLSFAPDPDPNIICATRPVQTFAWRYEANGTSSGHSDGVWLLDRWLTCRIRSAELLQSLLYVRPTLGLSWNLLIIWSCWNTRNVNSFKLYRHLARGPHISGLLFHNSV
jgi:hypothetical protein